MNQNSRADEKQVSDRSIMETRITPFLMLNADPKEVADFYTAIFKNSTIIKANQMQATFILDGQKFHSFKGGPHFSFSEGVSFFVRCGSQKEVDYFWTALSAEGGTESMCGWIKDRYGLSWQIIPIALMELLEHEDREKASKALHAMLKMKKIILKDIESAVDET
ncbi:VOC family protein [Leptospira ognonensis]|uniref:VOC family protein n=1 Tax=Leptospira ognonensis TaxID=2484945 RepID=A0A4R9JXT0_9LEPT|nr:VOC family protein [Leptospira ognonensis]TGL56995.1 VOC family protein [Leptospira ognonensis]